jgi:hypothetical protein
MFTAWQIAPPRAGDMFPAVGSAAALRIEKAEMA